MSSYQHRQDYIEVRITEPPEDSRRHSDSAKASPSRKGGSKKKASKTATVEPGSDTEQESSKMAPSRTTRTGSTSTAPRKASSNRRLTDDWTEVTEPEERRRIQNRIAQRKFREKQRELRDQRHRQELNQQYAHCVYHIPEPEDLAFEDTDLAGLPWGGLSIRHVVARGHAEASTGTLSHHSGHSDTLSVTAGLPGSGMMTPAPASSPMPPQTPSFFDTAADQQQRMLYGLDSYGAYSPAHHHAATTAAMNMMFDSQRDARGGLGGDVRGGYYDSPYTGPVYGEHDFDGARADGTQYM